MPFGNFPEPIGSTLVTFRLPCRPDSSHPILISTKTTSYIDSDIRPVGHIAWKYPGAGSVEEVWGWESASLSIWCTLLMAYSLMYPGRAWFITHNMIEADATMLATKQVLATETAPPRSNPSMSCLLAWEIPPHWSSYTNSLRSDEFYQILTNYMTSFGPRGLLISKSCNEWFYFRSYFVASMACHIAKVVCKGMTFFPR